jgi:hypothetical protein
VGTLAAPIDPSSPAPSPSDQLTNAVAAGGGTTAAGGATTNASGSAPWKPIALVLLLVGLVACGVLWWRRREPESRAVPVVAGAHEAVVAPVAPPSADPDVAAPLVPQADKVGGHVRIITPPGRTPSP